MLICCCLHPQAHVRLTRHRGFSGCKSFMVYGQKSPFPPPPPGYGHTALGLDAPPPLKLFAISDELEQNI